MKITCDHCGCVIDTEKDKKCPNCGAPFSKNKEYEGVKNIKKKQTDYDFREREADIHSKELQNQIVENTLNGMNKASKFSKVIVFIVLLVFIGIFVTIILRFNSLKTVETNKPDNSTNILDILNNNDKKEENVTINYNENYSNEEFEIKCDNISNYEYDYFEKEERRGNYNYYNFHIIFKNKTDSWKVLNTINLTYIDENGNEDIVAKVHSPNSKEAANTLDFFAKDIVTYSGNMTYEIPKYVKDVKLKYQNVTITIDNFKDKIK